MSELVFKYDREGVLAIKGKGNVVDNEGMALTKGCLFYPIVKNTGRVPVQARMGERNLRPVVETGNPRGMIQVVECERYFAALPDGFLRGTAPKIPVRPRSFREQIQNAASDEELTAIASKIQQAEKISSGTMRRLAKLLSDRGLQVRYNG